MLLFVEFFYISSCIRDHSNFYYLFFLFNQLNLIGTWQSLIVLLAIYVQFFDLIASPPIPIHKQQQNNSFNRFGTFRMPHAIKSITSSIKRSRNQTNHWININSNDDFLFFHSGSVTISATVWIIRIHSSQKCVNLCKYFELAFYYEKVGSQLARFSGRSWIFQFHNMLLMI